MRVKGILAIVAIVAAVGLVGAASMWPVLQSANAASCQAFFSGTSGVPIKQNCSSDRSDAQANALNSNAHFKNLK